MFKFDTDFRSTTKRQRWLLLVIAIFGVLVYGFTLAIDNVAAQYSNPPSSEINTSKDL